MAKNFKGIRAAAAALEQAGGVGNGVGVSRQKEICFFFSQEKNQMNLRELLFFCPSVCILIFSYQNGAHSLLARIIGGRIRRAKAQSRVTICDNPR